MTPQLLERDADTATGTMENTTGKAGHLSLVELGAWERPAPRAAFDPMHRTWLGKAIDGGIVVLMVSSVLAAVLSLMHI